MPWEKNFDLDIATDKAIQVFWKKGYEGTSMSDLIDAMGINKGSLYNAFGSKDELFNRALLRYDQLNRQEALKQLNKLEDPKQVEDFFVTIIKKWQKLGNVETTKNAREVAVSLVALIIGLRVLARGTYDAENLEAIKKQALQLLS